MTSPDSEEMKLVERLREACNGHPHAKIPWPHRILHEAAATIERLCQERDEAKTPNGDTAADLSADLHKTQVELDAAEAALSASKAEAERLREALSDARRTMRNCAGAIQSGQIVDKEIDRQLCRGYEAIDAALQGSAKQ